MGTSPGELAEVGSGAAQRVNRESAAAAAACETVHGAESIAPPLGTSIRGAKNRAHGPCVVTWKGFRGPKNPCGEADSTTLPPLANPSPPRPSALDR